MDPNSFIELKPNGNIPDFRPGDSVRVHAKAVGGGDRPFPYRAPLVDRVEVGRGGRVRRAKLYYLRDRVGKAARIKPGARARFEQLTAGLAVMPEEEYIEEE